MLFALLLIIGLAACGAGPDLEPAAPTPGPRPYQAATPSPTATPIPRSEVVVLPTTTPVIYKVQANDTMITIAIAYNITAEQLMAANPGVDPNFMRIDTELVIPVGGKIPQEPTITPVPITIQQLVCYPGVDKGLWCLASIHNGSAEMLENLSALVILRDAAGLEVASQQAYAPLNILPPGASMPLGVFFFPPVAPGVVAQAQLLTAIQVSTDDPRYVPVALQNTSVTLDWNGLSAQVAGQVYLPPQNPGVSLVWALAVAYDVHGNVAGYRRWESAFPMQPGGVKDFEFLLSSLGPEIDRVELLVEARP